MKRKIIIIVLTVILIFLFSSLAEAESTVKKFEANYGNISIIVNNKLLLPENEPLLINNTTYVPLRFISTALGADVYWDGKHKAIYISKNNNIDYNYEISRLSSELEAKKEKLSLLESKLDGKLEESYLNYNYKDKNNINNKVSNNFMNTEIKEKTIEANFEDISILVSNKLLLPESKPFLINGSAYVPLRFISTALGAEVYWDGTNRAIYISDKNQNEIDNLIKELEIKEEKISLLEEVSNDELNILNNEQNRINYLEKKLKNEYEKLKDVDIKDIDLYGDEDRIKVEIEVDLYGDDAYDWENLRNRDIERFIDDIVDDVQDEMGNSTKVEGEIKDRKDNEVLVEFEKDGYDDLEIYFNDNDYKSVKKDVNDVEDDLEGKNYSIDGNRFRIDYVNYDMEYDYITVYSFDVSNDHINEDDWEDFNEYRIRRDVERICEGIAEEFEDNADVEPERVFFKIYDEKIYKKFDQYEYDVDDREIEDW